MNVFEYINVECLVKDESFIAASFEWLEQGSLRGAFGFKYMIYFVFLRKYYSYEGYM